VLVSGNGGIVTVLVASAPNMRIAVLNPSLGVTKYLAVKERNIVHNTVNKKES
jgi:hypothetical protein